MLADTHAHLYWDNFQDDLDQVIQRAVQAGVSYIINIGVDVKTSKKALEQAKKIKSLTVKSTIGIHPHESLRYAQGKLSEDIEKLMEIHRNSGNKVVGVGECGLDYKEVDEKTKQAQRRLFQAQIDLAKKLNLPLIVHCREAWDEVLEMTKDHFGIYHCYSGDLSITQKVLSSRFLVSFACNLTYPKNEYLREAVKILPLERIVLETDSPFLPPQVKRGQRNEPANVLEVARAIAEIKNLSTEEIARQTTANVVNLFSI